MFFRRVSRSPRRTQSTVQDSPPYSPRNSPELTPTSPERPSIRTSPKRSISIAGGAAKTLVTTRRRPQSSDTNRSRSLPRAAPPTPEHDASDDRTHLVSAKSVADVMRDLDEKELEMQIWQDLVVSEPSLLDAHTKKRNQTNTLKHQFAEEQEHEEISSNKQPIGSAHSISNIAQDSQRLQTWPDQQDPVQDDGTAKKKSIKSSLKNMFTFKKR